MALRRGTRGSMASFSGFVHIRNHKVFRIWSLMF
jgi:hypothetical protein